MFLVSACMPGLLVLSSGYAIAEKARSVVACNLRTSLLGYGVYIFIDRLAC